MTRRRQETRKTVVPSVSGGTGLQTPAPGNGTSNGRSRRVVLANKRAHEWIF